MTSTVGENHLTDWTDDEINKLMGHKTPVRVGAERPTVTYPH